MRFCGFILLIGITLPYVLTAQFISMKNNDHKQDLQLIDGDLYAHCDEDEKVSLRGQKIQDIPYDFIKSKSISNVDLSNNKLKEIRIGSFDTATSLTCLDLSRNHIPTKNLLQFGHKTLKALDLTGQTNQPSTIELDDDSTEIDDTILYCDPKNNFPSLTYLDLSESRFGYLDHNFSSCFPRLSRLYLNNRIILNVTEDFFERLPASLQGLHLQGNNINKVSFPGIGPIKALFLDSNPLHDLGHELKSSSLEILTMSNCTLWKLDPQLLLTLPNLMVLDLSRNNLQDDSGFTRHESLEILSLSHNDFYDFPRLDYFPRLEKLSLSYNRIVTIRQRIGSPSLRVLSLRGNKIRIIDAGVFSECGSLEILDLANNMLQSLPPDWMHGLFNLHSLDLRNNLFKTIPNIFNDDLMDSKSSLTDIFIKSESFDPIRVEMIDYLPPNCTIHVG